MKTITKEYQIYSYNELSKEAKKKALEKWVADNNYPFLTDDLREYIHEELKDWFNELSVIKPFYSLSYCQGDGLMFEAIIEDKQNGNIFTIKHAGHYYHERSTNITGEDKNGNEIDTKDFEENIYIPICKRVADRGYEIIEYQDSEENFIEVCEANEYTFLSDGTMFNQ